MIPAVDADAAMMLGANGQFAIVQPSRSLVITRMGEGTGDASGKLQASDVAQWVRDAFITFYLTRPRANGSGLGASTPRR